MYIMWYIYPYTPIYWIKATSLRPSHFPQDMSKLLYAELYNYGREKQEEKVLQKLIDKGVVSHAAGLHKELKWLWMLYHYYVEYQWVAPQKYRQVYWYVMLINPPNTKYRNIDSLLNQYNHYIFRFLMKRAFLQIPTCMVSNK